MIPQQAHEEPFRCSTISLGLQIHINYFTILIHSPPEIVLLAADPHEDFVDVEGIIITLMLPFQPAGINGTELDAPESD